MKDITLKVVVKFCQLDELDENAQKLINKAIAATENSYAPYSHFHVGAALRLQDGTEIIGANQENAAFPVTLCAERSAIFNAQSNYPKLPITHLAIAAKNESGIVNTPVSPCGSCRQVLLEMEQRYHQKIMIYLYGGNGVYVVDSIEDILPLSFTDDSMR
ncbi:MAG: cytidine deaminase [Prevotella sp.]|nr:cytidine deaminase [Prevotella sp.]